LKYRAIVEKLDWRGKVIRSVRTYEDKSFKPSTDSVLENFVKTGKMDISKLETPDQRPWDILRKIAPKRSDYSFEDHEPGVRVCAGEYVERAGIQFVVYDPGNDRHAGWYETDSDVTAKGH